MLLDQRRDVILQLIQKQGFASLQSLSDATGASESTLRRDLELLDRNGQIRRTRGGAAYVGESLTPFEVRRDRASDEKRRLGKRTAELIQRVKRFCWMGEQQRWRSLATLPGSLCKL